jgi:hypothetical protein
MGSFQPDRKCAHSRELRQVFAVVPGAPFGPRTPFESEPNRVRRTPAARRTTSCSGPGTGLDGGTSFMSVRNRRFIESMAISSSRCIPRCAWSASETDCKRTRRHRADGAAPNGTNESPFQHPAARDGTRRRRTARRDEVEGLVAASPVGVQIPPPTRSPSEAMQRVVQRVVMAVVPTPRGPTAPAYRQAALRPQELGKLRETVGCDAT